MIEVLAMFMSETRLFVELKITTEAQIMIVYISSQVSYNYSLPRN